MGCEEGGPPNDTPVDAIADHAIPLPSTDPADLRPLADALADRTVVGLGEATHGTREFFRLKHRLIRFLVEEHGFRAVALESNFLVALALDDYVTRSEGDPREAI